MLRSLAFSDMSVTMGHFSLLALLV
uniref:Uncharacterized protein n=1 Tax=Anguilla anguilla TaxID=7936 RepID=A0A0E9UZW8_ANGAN